MEHELRSNQVAEGTESGYVLPLTLGVLLVLSLLLSVTLGQVSNAANRSALATEQAELSIDTHSIEQEIAFRALVETFAASRDLQDELVVKYDTRTPLPWSTRGEIVNWEGFFELPELTTFSESGFKVRIQDSRGLLDLNWRDPGYLEFVAKIFGVPASQRSVASVELARYIADRKKLGPSYGAVDEFAIEPPGLLSPEEICSLPVWISSDPCQSRDEFHFLFTAATGSVLNFDLAPDNLKKLLVPGSRAGSGFQATMDWVRVQQDNGFYDEFYGFGGQNIDFVVAIIPNSGPVQRRIRFKIGLDIDDPALWVLEDIREPVRPSADGG